jgi:GTPase involved in cell partitioning and DNA repair
MGYLSHLKRNEHCSKSRWIVKFEQDNPANLIREVKLVYNPSEYNKRTLHNKLALIAILEQDKLKRDKLEELKNNENQH